MSKRIVICCDGTWKRSDDRYVTNVVKLVRSVLPESPADGKVQVVYYDPGVGTGIGALNRMLGGLFGVGVAQNIVEAYGFLVDNFTPGDEIFLFGFSRGAFTVRSVAGVVRHCGILPKRNADRIKDAHDSYRRRYPSDAERRRAGAEFRRRYSRDDVEIKCIGVWDTVGALGIPGRLGFLARRRVGFHDVQLSSWVKNAYHALAIDERRGTFRPTLWEWKDGKTPPPGLKLEQVWFAGVHSDVGGGYAPPEAGLANLALDYMAEHATTLGLALDQEFLRGLVGDASVSAPLHDSRTGLFRYLAKHVRPLGVGSHASEDVSPTALERFSDPAADYPAPNLAAYLNRRPSARAPQTS